MHPGTREGAIFSILGLQSEGARSESLEAQPLQYTSTHTPVLGFHMEQLTGTRGTNTRGSVSWTGTVGSGSDGSGYPPPGTRFSVRRGATLVKYYQLGFSMNLLGLSWAERLPAITYFQIFRP